MPGVLVAGVSYSVYPNTPEPITKAEVVLTAIDKNTFQEKLNKHLKKFVGCHGSDRLLSNEELGCVKVEFVPVGNHGNSVLVVYICPTWEVCVRVCTCVCL